MRFVDNRACALSESIPHTWCQETENRLKYWDERELLWPAKNTLFQFKLEKEQLQCTFSRTPTQQGPSAPVLENTRQHTVKTIAHSRE